MLLMVLILGAMIARPMSWRAGKALLLAGFLLLQGWARVRGQPSGSLTLGAVELIVGGAVLASGIDLAEKYFRRRGRSPQSPVNARLQ